MGIRGGNGYAAHTTFGGILRRIASVRLPDLKESLSVDMLKSEYLPYEASETYRRILTEFDCKRAETLVETQRQLLRGA
jgi:hypothetical protein